MSRSRYESKESKVDESLFASKHNPRDRSQNGGSIGSRAGSGLARTGKSIIGANTVVLTRGELDRIRTMATIKTRAEQDADKAVREDARLEKMKAARARKKKMQELELIRKANEKNTYMDNVREGEANALLANAHEMMDEDEDLVKHMNQKCLYALTVGVRDAQVEEKKTRKSKRIEEERRQDILMEIDRLEDLQKRAENEKIRQVTMREDAKVIGVQMASRAKARLLEREQRDLEGRQMVAQIKRQEIEEEEKLRVKRIEGEVLLKQVLAANEESSQRKLLLVEREREEDDRIIGACEGGGIEGEEGGVVG